MHFAKSGSDQHVRYGPAPWRVEPHSTARQRSPEHIRMRHSGSGTVWKIPIRLGQLHLAEGCGAPEDWFPNVNAGWDNHAVRHRFDSRSLIGPADQNALEETAW